LVPKIKIKDSLSKKIIENDKTIYILIEKGHIKKLNITFSNI